MSLDHVERNLKLKELKKGNLISELDKTSNPRLIIDIIALIFAGFSGLGLLIYLF